MKNPFMYKSPFRVKEKRIRDIKITSFSEGLVLNGAFIKPKNKIYFNVFGNKIKIKESVSHTFKEKGGMIVFSTDVNAVIIKTSLLKDIKGFFRSKLETFKNRFLRYSKVNKVIKSFEDVFAYSIGNFFRGRYFDRENDLTFNEKSISIELIGIPSELLIDIAESIAKEFNQKEVLVKDYENNKIFLVDTK